MEQVHTLVSGGLSKTIIIIDFKSFSEKCPFMVRDQRNMKNCIFNEDFPTNCKKEICPFMRGGVTHVPY